MPTAICPTHTLNFNETFAMNIDKKLIICMASEKTFINPVTTTLVLDIYSNHGILKHIRQVVNVKLVFPNLPITTSTVASFFLRPTAALTLLPGDIKGFTFFLAAGAV